MYNKKEVNSMDIILIIRNKYDKLSKSEKKVADFVISNISSIEIDTITKVAAESGTSTSAVLRFCRSLGFNGYKEFRYEVIQYYRKSFKVNHKYEVAEPTKTFISSYLETLSLLENSGPQLYEKIVESLLKTNKIFLVGIYQSSLPAKYLSNGLQDLGIDSRYADDFNKASHLTNLISKQDTLVYFSISGNKSNFSQSMSELTHSIPNDSYLITINSDSPLSKVFKNTIILPGNQLKKQSIVDTQSLPMIFVELILNLIHIKLIEN